MVTLKQVKEHLRIDFNDIDDHLNDLIRGAVDRARTISGLSKEEFTHEMKSAIIDDISNMYQNESPSEHSILVYRRHARRPMF